MIRSLVMDNNELMEILEQLEKQPYKIQLDSVEQYPVEMLELLAVKLYEEHSRKDFYRTLLPLRPKDLLGVILSERFIKLNRNFEWTKENKERFIKVNDKITQAFEKAYNEAVSIAKELENRLNNNDDFVDDYEIIIKISPYMGEEFYDDDGDVGGIGFVLSEPISGCHPIRHWFGHSNLEISLSETPVYLDRTLNWNIEYFGNTFDNDYIGYGIHALLDTHQWSFKDIMNINTIWTDVEVRHQNFIEDI